MTVTRQVFLRMTGLAALAQAGRRLMAAMAPKRWAMVVDARKCVRDQGCVRCIDACHRAHNVPALPRPSHRVAWIWKERYEHAFPTQRNEYTAEAFKDKPVLVLCNHCDNPPCVRVCPTRATWKREDGLVMMDWHRCIGCRYCVAACPYGSRSFNWVDPRPHIPVLNADFPTRSKGVVEKCTFCEARLAQGRPPACVEACPDKALVFGNLADPDSEARKLLRARYTIRRKPELGTQPQIFYIV